jgi:hypothetical protein
MVIVQIRFVWLQNFLWIQCSRWPGATPFSCRAEDVCILLDNIGSFQEFLGQHMVNDLSFGVFSFVCKASAYIIDKYI